MTPRFIPKLTLFNIALFHTYTLHWTQSINLFRKHININISYYIIYIIHDYIFKCCSMIINNNIIICRIIFRLKSYSLSNHFLNHITINIQYNLNVLSGWEPLIFLYLLESDNKKIGYFYYEKLYVFYLLCNCFWKWLFVFINHNKTGSEGNKYENGTSLIVHLDQKSLVKKLRLNQFVREELKFIVHFPLMHHLLKCSCDISKIFSTVVNP